MRAIEFKVCLGIICSILLNSSNGQTVAVTEKGDTIYVYDNGMWSFELLEEMPEEINELAYLEEDVKLDTIATEFKVSSDAKKQVIDVDDRFIIKYNDRIWKRVPPATLNEDASFAFQGKESDIWCVVIAEETPIDHDKLFLIAKNTMKEYVGSDPEIIKTELRIVNGVELVRGVMKAQISGMSLIFDTYYFSNDMGSVQFTTWTSDKVWERNENTIEELLNGFLVN